MFSFQLKHPCLFLLFDASFFLLIVDCSSVLIDYLGSDIVEYEFLFIVLMVMLLFGEASEVIFDVHQCLLIASQFVLHVLDGVEQSCRRLQGHLNGYNISNNKKKQEE